MIAKCIDVPLMPASRTIFLPLATPLLGVANWLKDHFCGDSESWPWFNSHPRCFASSL